MQANGEHTVSLQHLTVLKLFCSAICGETMYTPLHPLAESVVHWLTVEGTAWDVPLRYWSDGLHVIRIVVCYNAATTTYLICKVNLVLLTRLLTIDIIEKNHQVLYVSIFSLLQYFGLLLSFHSRLIAVTNSVLRFTLELQCSQYFADPAETNRYCTPQLATSRRSTTTGNGYFFLLFFWRRFNA